jgi:hypothetical protein
MAAKMTDVFKEANFGIKNLGRNINWQLCGLKSFNTLYPFCLLLKRNSVKTNSLKECWVVIAKEYCRVRKATCLPAKPEIIAHI